MFSGRSFSLKSLSLRGGVVEVINSCTLVDANISTWGACLTDAAFLGNVVLAEMFFYLIAAMVVYKMRLPGTMILPMGTLFTVALFAMSQDSPITWAIMVVSLMLSAFLVVYVIYKKLLGA